MTIGVGCFRVTIDGVEVMTTFGPDQKAIEYALQYLYQHRHDGTVVKLQRNNSGKWVTDIIHDNRCWKRGG